MMPYKKKKANQRKVVREKKIERHNESTKW
jgi:hypothetical protein